MKYNTLLKIIFILVIINYIIYFLLIRCKNELFQEENKFTLNHKLLSKTDRFNTELECIDTIKLKLLNNEDNTDKKKLNELSSQEIINLNIASKNMCEHDSCHSNICLYKKIMNIPPSKIIFSKKAYILKNDTVTLFWNKPSSTLPITKYIVIIEPLDENPIKIQILHTNNLNLLRHKITNLKNTNYKISIIAENEMGESEPSTIDFLVTNPTITTMPPTTSSVPTTSKKKFQQSEPNFLKIVNNANAQINF